MINAAQRLFRWRREWALKQGFAAQWPIDESAAVLDAMGRSRELAQTRLNELSAEAVELEREKAALLRSLQTFSAFSMTALVALWTLANATGGTGGGPSAPWIRTALPYGFSGVTLFGLELFAEIVSLGAIRRAVEIELASLHGAFTHVRESANLRASRLDPGRVALVMGWAMVYIVAFYLGLQEALTGAFAEPPFRSDSTMWSPPEWAWLVLYLTPLAIMEVLTLLQARCVYRLAKDTPAHTAKLLRSGKPSSP